MAARPRSAARRTPTGKAATASRRWCAGRALSRRTARSTTSSRPRTGCATLVAAAGEPDIKSKLLQGYDADGKTFKVHLDGYDQRDLLAGKGPDKRHEFFYWTDDGNLAGLRYDQWKAVFLEQHAAGLDVWAQPLVQLRMPMLFNLRSDPFERAQHEAGDYVRWFVEHAFLLVPAQALVGQHLQSFRSSRRDSGRARSPSSRPWRSSDYRRPAIKRGAYRKRARDGDQPGIRDSPSHSACNSGTAFG